jgi:hypothetical protein
MRTVVLACSVALAVLSLREPAQAIGEPVNQLSYMTFSQPVSIPGMTLPAGEYIFRLPSRDNSRMVLQILSKDRSHVYAMLLTKPTSRGEATDDPAVSFHESPAGTPPPLRAWFYAGQRFGLEFAYPEHEAELIALHSSHPVLTSNLTYIAK